MNYPLTPAQDAHKRETYKKIYAMVEDLCTALDDLQVPPALPMNTEDVALLAKTMTRREISKSIPPLREQLEMRMNMLAAQHSAEDFNPGEYQKALTETALLYSFLQNIHETFNAGAGEIHVIQNTETSILIAKGMFGQRLKENAPELYYNGFPGVNNLGRKAVYATPDAKVEAMRLSRERYNAKVALEDTKIVFRELTSLLETPTLQAPEPTTAKRATQLRERIENILTNAQDILLPEAAADVELGDAQSVRELRSGARALGKEIFNEYKALLGASLAPRTKKEWRFE